MAPDIEWFKANKTVNTEVSVTCSTMYCNFKINFAKVVWKDFIVEFVLTFAFDAKMK
jgi:hypothetical protein